MSCPDDTTLHAFVTGDLPEAGRAPVLRHIEGCDLCRQTASHFLRLGTTIGSERTLPARVASSAMGRFELGAQLGAGGLGIVFSARDPVLDRAVAVKLVRTGQSVLQGAAEQFLLEAQAMARVNHPNVVTVFEAAREGDDVFIVMELVEGGNLHDWLGTPRLLRERFKVLYGAGLGLQAIHRAGLVHRDFKPLNVLVGVDGRARVADLGLSNLVLADVPGASRLVGTPMYMAPEQLRGETVEAPADVYGFALTAWETFLGSPPWSPSSIRELHDLRSRGAPPLPRWLVPDSLGEVLRRALDPVPARRPALDELLRELRRAAFPASRSRALLSVGVSALVVAGFGAGLWKRAQNRHACEESAAITLLWSNDERARLDNATLVKAFDEWAQEWKHERLATCTGDQSGSAAAPREDRSACLERQRQRFRLLLVGAHTETSPQAPAVLTRLIHERPPAAACGAAERQVAPSPDEAEAVIRAVTLSALGEHDRVLELADAWLAEGRTLLESSRAQLLYCRAQAFAAKVRHQDAFRDVTALVALEVLQRDGPLRAAAQSLQARLLYLSDEVRASRVIADGARKLVLHEGSAAVKVEFLIVDSDLQWEADDLNAAHELLLSALEVAREAGDETLEVLVVRRLVLISQKKASFEEHLDEEVERALALERISTATRVRALDTGLMRAMQKGQSVDAQRFAAEMFRLSESMPPSPRRWLDLRFTEQFRCLSTSDAEACRRALTLLQSPQGPHSLDFAFAIDAATVRLELEGPEAADRALAELEAKFGQDLLRRRALEDLIYLKGRVHRALGKPLPPLFDQEPSLPSQCALRAEDLAARGNTRQARLALAKVVEPRLQNSRVDAHQATITVYAALARARLGDASARPGVEALVAVLDEQPSPQWARGLAHLAMALLTHSCADVETSAALLKTTPSEPRSFLEAKQLQSQWRCRPTTGP